MANDNETVKDLCNELREYDLIPPPRGAWVIYAERILAAHNREMERNESLLNKAGELCAGLMNKANAQHAEIAKLRALVKELSFNLDAWVHGGRFAVTESDLEVLEKYEKEAK